MSERKCPNCNRLFHGGDKIRALVLAEWIDLKSSITYAISKPTACLEVYHRNCNQPQIGEHEGD